MGRIGFPTQTPTTPSPLKHIAVQVLAAPAASVSFSGIDTKYRILILESFVINDANAKDVYVRLNGDAGAAQYNQQAIQASSTTISGSRDALTRFQPHLTSMSASQLMEFAAIVVKSTASTKGQILISEGHDTSPLLNLVGGQWENTAALMTRMDVLAASNNFAANSAFGLYGIEI
jgi:hypothetical protein